MKIRIKSGDVPDYLTRGKVYETCEEYPDLMHCKIKDDKGRYMTINLYFSHHHHGFSWDIVDE